MQYESRRLATPSSPPSPPSPIEPTGFFTGVQVRPIIVGVVVDYIATYAAMYAYFFIYLAQELSKQGEVTEEQITNYMTSPEGLMIGFCRDTGGSWSEEFVAHPSQVLPVPDHLSDEEAVLAEPFAVSLHAVLQNLPEDDDTVLIIGGGVIGLCAIVMLLVNEVSV